MAIVSRNNDVQEAEIGTGPAVQAASDDAALQTVDRVPKVLGTRDSQGFIPFPMSATEFTGLTGFGLSDQETANLRGQPKIGAFENTARNGLNVVPLAGLVSTARVFAAVKRVQADAARIDEQDRIARGTSEGLTFPGFVLPATRAAAGPEASVNNRSFFARESDFNIVNQYLRQKQEEQVRGVTIGGKIAAGALELPEFMVSFLLTGGLAAAGKEGAKQVVGAGLAKALGQRMGGVVTSTIGVAAGAAVRTAVLPQFTAETAMKRQLDSSFFLTDAGVRVRKEATEKPVVSLLKGVGDTFIEMFSEETGAAVSKLTRLIPGYHGLQRTMEKTFEKSDLAKRGVELWTKSGWNGFVEELGEERIGDLLRAVTGIEDFGAENPESMIDRMVASLPNGEELLVEAGITALPAGVRLTTMAGANLIAKRRLDSDQAADAPTRELSDAEISQIVFPEGEVNATSEIGPTPDEIAAAQKRHLAESIKTTKKARSPKGTPAPVATSQPGGKTPTAASVFTASDQVVVEGRVEKINQEQSTIAGQIERLAAEKEQLEAEDKSTEKVDAKTEALIRRSDKLDAEVVSIVTDRVPVRKRASILTTASKAMGAISRKVQAGVKLTRQEIRAAQGVLADLINKNLPLEERGKFISSIRRINSQASLETALPGIVKRIDTANQKRAKRQVLGTIRKALDGKRKGKLPPDVQTRLDQISAASKLTPAKGRQAIAENLAKIGPEGELSDELSTQNDLINMMSGLRENSVAELLRIENGLNLLISEGRLEALSTRAAETALRAEAVANARTSLIGDTPIDPTAKPLPQAIQSIQQWGRAFGKTITGWTHLMDTLSQFDRGSKQFESFLSTYTDVGPLEQKEKGDVDRIMRRFTSVVQQIYGVDSQKKAFRKMLDDQRVINHGEFVDVAGNTVALNFSRAEVRKIWMEFQDPKLRESLESARGGYVKGVVDIKGFTPAIQDALFNDFLTVADKNFARAQFPLYRGLYIPINKLYRESFGANLPFNEVYSPTSRGVSKNPVESFHEDQGYRRSISSSFLKTRVRNFRPMRVQSDLDAMSHHITTMVHWLHWHTKLKDINAVFGDRKNRAIIIDRFGLGTSKTIDKFILDFTRNSRTRAEAYDGWVRTFKNNFTVATLAAKPKQLVVQMGSMFAALGEVGPIEMVQSWVKLGLNPRKELAELTELSDLLRTRRGRNTRDLNDVQNQNQLKRFGAKQTISNFIMLPTHMGDLGGVVLGGYPVYDQAIRAGLSKKEATKKFERFVANTQQSADLSQLSDLQRGGPFATVFTMFTSAQNQFLRSEVSTIRNLVRGRLTAREFGREIAVTHIIIPQVIQLIANFGEWDNEDQLRAAITGALNGIFILRDVIDTAAQALAHAIVDSDERFRFLESEHPIFAVSNQIWRGVFDVLAGSGDADTEKLMKGWKRIIESAGQLGGVPAKQVNSIYEGYEDIGDGEVKRGVLKSLGWSPYIVDKRLDED